MTKPSVATWVAQLGAGLRRLLGGFRLQVGDPIELLHEINWSAPWHEGTGRRDGACDC